MAAKRPARTAKNVGVSSDQPAVPGAGSPLLFQYRYAILQPWPCLLFLMPFLLAFEIGVYFSQGTTGGADQLVATYLIERLVIVLGAGRFGYIFPGLAVVVTLLAWHLVSHYPWRVDVMVLLGMAAESLAWTLPLLTVNRLLLEAFPARSVVPPDYWAQIVRGLGAGLYEEFVFRLVLIAGLDILLVNVLKVNRTTTRVVSVLISAGLFSGQHHHPLGSEPFELTDFIFRTGAGIYLAILFLKRGFGIAAGCHMFYNLIVISAMSIRFG